MAIKTRSGGTPNTPSAGGSGAVTPNGALWDDAPNRLMRNHVLLEVHGPTGTGRTQFALTAPGPIALLHASEKVDLVYKYAHKIGPNLDGKSGVLNFGGVFRGTVEQKKAAAEAKLNKVKAALEDAYTWARTIVIDTHSELWELLRLAKHGTLTPRGVPAAIYGALNADWRDLIKLQFREQEGTNLILIGQEREKYRNDKPTGIMEAAGQKETGYFADVVVTMTKSRGVFTAEIEKGWINGDSEGETLDNELATFEMVMTMICEGEGTWS